MSDDRVSISAYLEADAGPHEFDGADWERLRELDELVATANGAGTNKSDTIRRALHCYLGYLDGFATEGGLEDAPTGAELKHSARQTTLDLLREE